MRNRYLRHARISEAQFRETLQLWCADVGALTASKLCGLTKITTHRIYGLLRARVVALDETESAPFTESVEADESYFGPGGSEEYAVGGQEKK